MVSGFGYKAKIIKLIDVGNAWIKNKGMCRAFDTSLYFIG